MISEGDTKCLWGYWGVIVSNCGPKSYWEVLTGLGVQ